MPQSRRGSEIRSNAMQRTTLAALALICAQPTQAQITYALVDQKHAAPPAAPRRFPNCRRTPTARSTSIFGPKEPAGKGTNWVPTDPARKFEVMARFYAPKK